MRRPRERPDHESGWPDPDRLSLQTRFQRFLERHPRSLFTFVSAVLVYVTIGAVTKLARSHATVRDGWLLAVILGLAIPVTLIALVIKDVRRPYSRTTLGSLLGLVVCFVIGFALNEPLIFSGWASIPYQVTTAFQAGTLALFTPIALVLTAGVLLVTFLAFIGRRPRLPGRQ
jgi:hypothetical protein